MEKDESPAVYCGASQFHIHYDNFVLKEGEPMKPFMKEEVLEECSWLDMKKCSGSMDSTTFTLFPSVEYISMNECTIKNCLPMTFEPLEKLRALDIRKSDFPIDKHVFEGSKRLETLSISNFNFIKCGHIFSNLSVLINLTLENCTFDIMKRDMFAGLNNLKYLSINDSEINEITNDCFNNLLNLEGLNIRDNKIGQFDPISILELNKLERLSLHHNETSSKIDYSTFKQLPVLQSILFDNNIYDNLDFSGFKTLKNVEIGFTGEQDDNVTKSDDGIAEKLKSMNIECQYVFCGKVDFNEDDKDMMCCC